MMSSQYCRAWQIADLASGNYEKTADRNFESAKKYTEAEIQAIRENVTPYLCAVPSEGNTILVGHDDLFGAATGIYLEPMGVASVLRPGSGGEFDL